MGEKTVNGWFEVGSPRSLVDPSLNREAVGLEKIQSEQLVGIEVELEKSNQVVVALRSQVWAAHGDGSLRNAGLEWVSQPIPACDAPAALYDLFSSGANQCSFTPRTSVHVHVDCSRLTKDTVLDVVLLYMHFERRLYNFVGRNRIRNIYCVPINECGYGTGILTRRFDQIVTSWRKYIGLNLLPLSRLGTLEFRQMHGTSDVTKLSVWIRMITSMFEYVKKQGTKNIRERLSSLWTEEELTTLGKEVFGNDAVHLTDRFVDSQMDIFTAKLAFVTPRAASSFGLETFIESPYNLFDRKST
jgi:hypothetical protein